MGVNEELYAKSLEDLVAFEQAAARQGLKGLAQQVPLAPVYGDESWAVTPLGRDAAGPGLLAGEPRPPPRAGGGLEKNPALAGSRPPKP